MRTEVVRFQGKDLVITEEQLVPVNQFADALGLTRRKVREMIDRDAVLHSVRTIKGLPATDGKTYQTLCIPLDYLQGLLFKVDAGRYQGERREVLIRYQKECYKALAEHFSGSKKCACGVQQLGTSENFQPDRSVEDASRAKVAELQEDLARRLVDSIQRIINENRITEVDEIHFYLDRLGESKQNQFIIQEPYTGAIHPATIRRAEQTVKDYLNLYA